ncbi:hypothetical protein M407DRAFT_245143 [Tulasnella calospora MUT 4182]|uniref:Uncharacterized protein n=1 Tax=Tulasnella calospora MUT 4182 TaxID=1051891 RepID=A0A0C3Q277_9AGAM|nr:hypothetical protein M407DRAFT_245143 [Tulasnella calospora MUT 4182]
MYTIQPHLHGTRGQRTRQITVQRPRTSISPFPSGRFQSQPPILPSTEALTRTKIIRASSDRIPPPDFN